jgi:hypothetical protein
MPAANLCENAGSAADAATTMKMIEKIARRATTLLLK